MTTGTPDGPELVETGDPAELPGQLAIPWADPGHDVIGDLREVRAGSSAWSYIGETDDGGLLWVAPPGTPPP
jgi:hypothetical protein